MSHLSGEQHQDDDEDTTPVLNDKFFKKFLSQRWPYRYYNTRYLNECLYLHHKGFKKIEGLDDFTELKVLYLEANGTDIIL